MPNKRTLALRIATALALTAASPAALAQQAFTSPTGLYSLTIQPGWTTDPSGTGTPFKVDAAFVPGGDVSKGSVFISLAKARESLQAEKAAFVGDTPVTNERHVTIDGIDCLTFTLSEPPGDVINNSLICELTAPDASGHLRAAFIMSDTATPSTYDAETATFWQFANSIRWIAGTTPG